MNKYLYIFLTLTIALISSCSNDEDIAESFDPTWEEDDYPEGTVATVKGFEPGDVVTRSSWDFNGQKFVFGWSAGDQVGVVSTAGIAKTIPENDENSTWNIVNAGLIEPQEEDPYTLHPCYSSNKNLCYTVKTNNIGTKFVTRISSSNSQTAIISATTSSFEWSDQYRWTAYYPYETKKPANYDIKTFNYEGQKQKGIPDFAAKREGKNSQYLASESSSCAHLSKIDYMISPETQYDGEGRTLINFQLRHIGAIMRLYMRAPEKDLVITKVQLICDKKIFYTRGTFDLTSHPYDATADDGNYGTILTGYGTNEKPSQITPDPTSLTNMIELDFEGDLAKTYYDSSKSYLRYMAAYFMIYPITYNKDTDGNLFAYVTAYEQNDPDKKDLHFVSSALDSKTMRSGFYYQWNLATHEDDGLYPIELTATLLPWQDIVGGGIETDLTK